MSKFATGNLKTLKLDPEKAGENGPPRRFFFFFFVVVVLLLLLFSAQTRQGIFFRIRLRCLLLVCLFVFVLLITKETEQMDVGIHVFVDRCVFSACI